MDSQANDIQQHESPKTTLDRTRHLLARSRQTLDAADRRLHSDEDGEQQPELRQSRDPRR